MNGLQWPPQNVPSTRGNTVLLELFIAAVLPYVLARFYHFTSTLPRWLGYVVLHHVLHREVVTGPVTPRDEKAVQRTIHNDRLVTILLEYIQHCVTQRKEQNEEETKKNGTVRHGSVNTTELPYAELVLLPASPLTTTSEGNPLGSHSAHGRRNSYGSSSSSGMLEDMFWARNGHRSQHRSRHKHHKQQGDAAGQLYTTLQHSYRVATLPVTDAAMEVEPGLLVHHVRSAMRWHSYIAIDNTDEKQDNKEEDNDDEEESGSADMYGIAFDRRRNERSRDALRRKSQRRFVEQQMRQRHNQRAIRLFKDLLGRLRERHTPSLTTGRRFQIIHSGWAQDEMSSALLNNYLNGYGLDSGAGDDNNDEEEEDEDDDVEMSFLAQLRRGAHRARQPRYKSDVVGPQLILECYDVRPALLTRAWHWLQSHTVLFSDSSEWNTLCGSTSAAMKRSRIDVFVDRAVAWYDAMQAAAQAERSANSARYLILPVTRSVSSFSADNGGTERALGGGDDEVMCGTEPLMPHVKRYLLPASGGKDFGSLFFTQKPRVLQILDQFVHRTGKFAIPGLPRRLTWLLYGPPGTGKTSLLRAMARQLRRHVVILPLLALRQRRTLRQWLHEQHVICDKGSGFTSKGDDAMSCHSNDHEEETAAVQFCLRPSQVIYLIEDIDALVDTGSMTGIAGGGDTARVDLYSVLHILADATAAEDRIVVLSTNHIARVQSIFADKGIQTEKIHLSYMDEACAAEMLTYYFQTTLDDTQRNKLHDYLVHCSVQDTVLDEATSRHAIAPARLEQLCMMCDSVDEVLDSLQRPRCDAESIVGRDMF